MSPSGSSPLGSLYQVCPGVLQNPGPRSKLRDCHLFLWLPIFIHLKLTYVKYVSKKEHEKRKGPKRALSELPLTCLTPHQPLGGRAGFLLQPQLHPHLQVPSRPLPGHHGWSESVDTAAQGRVRRMVGSLVAPEHRVWAGAQRPTGLGKKVGRAGCSLGAKGFALCPVCIGSH